MAYVEVDPDTGLVEILDYVAVDDAGTIINPLLARGQIHGGVVQGVGQALYEEARYDPDSGQLLTGSLLDYAVPRADSLPKIRSQFQQTPSPTNPLGVKGIGESGAIGAPPTIVHAVLDALVPFGLRILICRSRRKRSGPRSRVPAGQEPLARGTVAHRLLLPFQS